MREWVSVYLACMSLAAFCAMGFDKRRARAGGRRVRERTLWVLALLGGGPGAFLGMRAFRHKTRHLVFQIGFPVLGVLDMALFIWTWVG